MNVIATILAASWFVYPQNRIETFDPAKTSIISGFKIHCPTDRQVAMAIPSVSKGWEICKGVFLEAPPDRKLVIQYMDLTGE